MFEIRTGSGYQAAALAQLVGQVYTVEIVPDLAESARKTLSALGYSNVLVREGDGYRVWPAHAPFHRILMTAAPSELPKALIEQTCARWAPGHTYWLPLVTGTGRGR